MSFATIFSHVPSILVCVGGVLYILAILTDVLKPYLWQWLQRTLPEERAEPHIGTWLVWTLLTALTGFGMWQAGSLNGMVITSVCIDVIILALSVKYGRWSWNKIDSICMLIAGAGFIICAISSVPMVAVIAGLTATVVASTPTLRKAFFEPESEPGVPYYLFASSCVFQIMAMPSWALEHSLQPVVWLLNGLSILGCIMMSDSLRDSLTRRFGIIRPL